MTYFSEKELACSCCGTYFFDEDILKILNRIRREFGPMPVTSGYRCPQHPIEAAKTRLGAHTTGKAVDIGVDRDRAYRLVETALGLGCPRSALISAARADLFTSIGTMSGHILQSGHISHTICCNPN